MRHNLFVHNPPGFSYVLLQQAEKSGGVVICKTENKHCSLPACGISLFDSLLAMGMLRLPRPVSG